MISVEEALTRILKAFGPLPSEMVALPEAVGRTLAEPVRARLTQPPWRVAAMDGYAVCAADVADAPVTLRRIGEAAAGAAFDGTVGPGEAVRIFTGAPFPAGADTLVIQEVTATDGETVTIREPVALDRNIRPMGGDFTTGSVGIEAGRILTARDIGFAAAMNVPWLMVHRQPRIAILATGDEVVMPGDPRGPNQIVSSNGLALVSLIKALGGVPVNLGVARDTRGSLAERAAAAAGCDLLVTTGGASEGEHDLVSEVLGDKGKALDFWKIAMRPGKPLMFGHAGSPPLLGLPGNPVSSQVCAVLFLKPVIRTLLGLPPVEPFLKARLGAGVRANDRRQDHLRGTLTVDADGTRIATPFANQDSSLTSLLARADCLIVRPPQAPAAEPGALVDIIPLSGGCLSI